MGQLFENDIELCSVNEVLINNCARKSDRCSNRKLFAVIEWFIHVSNSHSRNVVPNNADLRVTDTTSSMDR